ncbi:pilus assembly protein PilM [Candidatus Omnitrophota bacterium]
MFKTKNAVGIFFGPRGVSIVASGGRGKTRNYTFSLYPQDLTKPGEAAVPKDSIFNVFLDSEEEIIAFLSKALRESRVDIESSDVVACVPSRDLIVRFFEIPPIPRREIDSSISFEIKKYIPFKTEDIVYDYQTQSQKNVIEVLFAGMKKEELEKYNNILTKLKVKILAIEPSQFSLLRLLKIEKVITSKEAVVVVELEKGEGAISIIDNAIPCFSRDIKLSSSGGSGQIDIETLSFRLINEVRVSMDYFRRQFLKKGIDRIIILSNEESSKELISNFNKELGIPVLYKNTNDIFGAKEEYSLNLAKALGASFKVHKPSSLVINLAKKSKTTNSATPGAWFSPQQMITEIFEEIMEIPRPVLTKTMVFPIVILLGIFLWGTFRKDSLKQELSRISKGVKSSLSEEYKGLDDKNLTTFVDRLRESVATYRRVFEKRFLLSEKLLVFPKLLPEGVWVEHVSFDREKGILILKGVVYSEDEKKASEGPYVFIANLKGSSLFSNNVALISVTTLRKAFRKDYKVNIFDVEVKLDI